MYRVSTHPSGQTLGGGDNSTAAVTSRARGGNMRPRCKFTDVYLHTCFGRGGRECNNTKLGRAHFLYVSIEAFAAACQLTHRSSVSCPRARLDIWSRGAHSSPAWTRNAPCACLHRRRRRRRWRSSPAPRHPWAALAAAEEAYWYANAHSRSSHRDILNHIKMLTQSVAFFRQQRADRSLSLTCVRHRGG